MAAPTSLHSTLLDGVLTPTASDSEEETAEKTLTVYDGDAEQFRQWESQTRKLITSVKDEKDFPATMNQIIKGL
eukprot:9936512-Karenia_brevis.AAC.1